jgi:NO-binding membrane sensor protein with MHYT domain
MILSGIYTIALMGVTLLVAYICSFVGMYLAHRAYKKRGKDDRI